jgi:L-rhamnose-H+ transport protein
MIANPPLGVLFHTLGGLAAASFYIPFKSVRNWSWETYWITGGLFSWLIAPTLFATLIIVACYHVPLFEILHSSPAGALAGAFGFGLLWGIGGLTFGLSMRYLGIALGYAIALGFCAAFGQLIPPFFQGKYPAELSQFPQQIILAGVLVCLLGIAFSGMAGVQKEKELSAEQKKKTSAEFSLVKGLIIATVCGLLSACMAFALTAGAPIGDRAVALGAPALWSGLPILIVILLGGLASNALWCVVLLLKNRTFPEFIGMTKPPAPRPPLLRNYALAALAGITWYFQFFFYTMGASLLGKSSEYSSWTLHMASIVIFATLWGIFLHEWKGTSRKTHALIAAGLLSLVAATLIIGYGNYRSTQDAAQPPVNAPNTSSLALHSHVA